MVLGTGWIIDGNFSIADIAALVFVTRAEELAPEIVTAKPRVMAWLNAIRARPSYAGAGIGSFMKGEEEGKAFDKMVANR
jgi:glutathione S-transferase